jgi:16S rRNA (adenine1518-N6/adenine1519-N6)-dimethyltransferase
VSLQQRAKQSMADLGINPNKLRGQNFCTEPGVLQAMIGEAELLANETILEIGPGLGFLTEQLLMAGHKVIAIEVEAHFIKLLRKLESLGDLQVLHADALKLYLEKYLPENYSVVSNLPYSITGSIIRRLLTLKPAPRNLTVLLQREVAERMIAPAGEMNLLALAVQLYSRPRIARHVSAQSFWPAPKVESSIIKMSDVGKIHKITNNQEKLLWQIAKLGFANKRKQMHNNISKTLPCDGELIKKYLIELGLDDKARAQQLSVEQWIELTKKLEK